MKFEFIRTLNTQYYLLYKRLDKSFFGWLRNAVLLDSLCPDNGFLLNRITNKRREIGGSSFRIGCCVRVGEAMQSLSLLKSMNGRLTGKGGKERSENTSPSEMNCQWSNDDGDDLTVGQKWKQMENRSIEIHKQVEWFVPSAFLCDDEMVEEVRDEMKIHESELQYIGALKLAAAQIQAEHPKKKDQYPLTNKE